MKILMLEKVRDNYEPFVVRVTYKIWLGKIRVRDAVKSSSFWRWCDTGDIIDNDIMLSKFQDSSMDRYVLNNGRFQIITELYITRHEVEQ